jgi:hypothetical protein
MAPYISWFREQREEKTPLNIFEEISGIATVPRLPPFPKTSPATRKGSFDFRDFLEDYNDLNRTYTSEEIVLGRIEVIDLAFGYHGKTIPRTLIYESIFYPPEFIDNIIAQNKDHFMKKEISIADKV